MSTLLVIDDDRAVLYTIERTFQGTGVSVLTAKTVREGLELIERKPDVVLLDIMLPEGSGLEAVREDPGPRSQAADHLHHGRRHERHHHRGDEAGSLRLSAQAARSAEIERIGRSGPGNSPADAGPRRAADQHRRHGARRRPHHRPQPGDVRGLQSRRPRRSAERNHADRRRERHGQRAGGPRDLSPQQPLVRAVSRPSTARPCRKLCWKASCSDTRRARSRAPITAASASSSSAPAGRSSWTRWATCPLCSKAKSCVCCRRSVSSAWGATRRSAPMCV